MIAKVVVKYITLVRNAIQAGKTKSSDAKRDLRPKTLMPPLFKCWLLSGTSEPSPSETDSKSMILLCTFWSQNLERTYEMFSLSSEMLEYTN